MKIAILPLLLAAVIPACAQTATPSNTTESPISLTGDTQSALVKLGGQMMVAGKAYEYDRQLSDEIGPRLTGSGNYEKAVEWAVGEFKRMGLSNVHTESWEIPAAWEPETAATGRIVAPHEQRLHIESEGWSPSTPSGGVRGNVLVLKDMSPDALKESASAMRGAIVLVDEESLDSVIEKGLGKAFDALDAVEQSGAKGILMGVGAVNNAPSMLGATDFVGKLATIPIANVGLEDTLLLKRLAANGPVEVEFAFKNRIREHVKVNNVVAEIPGRESNGEYVLVGGHLDSWNGGTGAQDNGTGAASVMSVAEAVKTAGLAPRRTMRFVLFGGEEEGLIGSIHYAHDHAAEAAKCVGVFVTDTGAEPPNGWFVFGRKDSAKALGLLEPLLGSLDAARTTDAGGLTFETDEAAFLVEGVPSFVLWSPMGKYMAIHHKPSDTFDKVDHRDLNLGAATVGITAYAFADAAGTLKHYSAAEVETQLKAIEALDTYKDLQEHKIL
jgi:carboxypeptidase Q